MSTRSKLRALLVALSVASLASIGHAATWGEGYVPNLPVTNQEGQTFDFYDDLIKDKIVVIDFIYTNCPDICSLSTARLAQVQKRLGDIIGRDVFMYSISLDPANDTPEVLNAYASAFKIAPGWMFLTGKPEDIGLIRYKLGERSRKLSEHRVDIVLGNASTGEWARTSTMADIDLIVREIREMDPVWRNTPHPVVGEGSEAQAGGHNHGANNDAPLYVIRSQPGEALFLKACSACHTVGGGELVGPDLAGLSERRERDWIVAFMTDPDEMAERDPIGRALAAQFPGITMPNLGLSEVDAGDLIEYLDARTAALPSSAPHSHEAGHEHQEHDASQHDDSHASGHDEHSEHAEHGHH